MIAKWIDSHVAVIVLIVAVIALTVPCTFTWMPTATVTWLLGIVMFGMGLTLSPKDFKIVFVKPLPVIIGCLAQFTIMPLLSWGLCKVFALPLEISIGMILVGCCPGGTASNIMTYLAKGDMALSVCMTGLSTLLAPILTPLLTWILAGETVDVNIWSMMYSVLQVVILPIILGLIVKHYFDKFTQRVLAWLPTISTFAVGLIIGIVLSANASRVLTCGWLIFFAVILHNLFGLTLGFIVGKVMGLNKPQRNAIAIEVGMQNSGLATSLAATHFVAYPLATIPGAIFSVWHNFSGAIAASILKKYSND